MCIAEGRGGRGVGGALGDIFDGGGGEWLYYGESAGTLGGRLGLSGIWVYEAAGGLGGREVGVGADAGLAVALVDYSADDDVDGHCGHEGDPEQ